jgi:hypothetical protein
VQLNGSRGGFGGGGERLLTSLSDLAIDTDDEERNRTVFKFEFRFNERVLLLVEAGRVEAPLIGRLFLRLDTLACKQREVVFRRAAEASYLSNVFGFLPLLSINKPLGTTSLLGTRATDLKIFFFREN